MKIQRQDRLMRALYGIIATLFLIATFHSGEVQAANYYLAPYGVDTGPGTTSDSPWKTFNFAIPKLLPGDTLVLADGTYNNLTSGYPDIRCGASATNGTAAQPITVKAENERLAFLQGTGNENVLFITNCAYWRFEGLRVASVDSNIGVSGGVPVYATASNHLTFRRLLVSHNNRYKNSSLFILGAYGNMRGTDNSLIEESEFYTFHRHSIIIIGDNNIVRRNYVNSRDRQDLPDGRYSDPINTGDGGITIYPGDNNIVENNIIESTGIALDIEADYGTATNNHFLGNISLNTNFGVVLHARGNTIHKMPQGTFLENHVSLNARYYGGYFRSSKNTQCLHCMALDGKLGGFVADTTALVGDGQPSAYYKNSLVVNNTTYGFRFVNQNDFGIDSSTAFGHTTNFQPANQAQYASLSSVDPGLGSCKVFIPDTSLLKGAGPNKTDIGANVLYRYQDGELTDIPLWSVATGEFTCGAQVAGFNDIPGSSCFDVHERLHVNTHGCSLPAGYGYGEASDSQPPLPPTNVVVIN